MIFLDRIYIRLAVMLLDGNSSIVKRLLNGPNLRVLVLVHVVHIHLLLHVEPDIGLDLLYGSRLVSRLLG